MSTVTNQRTELQDTLHVGPAGSELDHQSNGVGVSAFENMNLDIEDVRLRPSEKGGIKAVY